MDFIKNNILNCLKHKNCVSFLQENVLREFLWYFTSCQSYCQRTNLFDGSWITTKEADIFVLAILKSKLNLDVINVFDNLSNLYSSVDSLSNDSAKDNRLDIIKENRKSIFILFFEGIRNALAHGTFNYENGRFFLINQKKAKQDSEIKIFLNSTDNLFGKIYEVGKYFADHKDLESLERNEILLKVSGLYKKNGKYYKKNTEQQIIFNDEFQFKTRTHKNEITNLINDLNQNTKHRKSNNKRKYR